MDIMLQILSDCFGISVTFRMLIWTSQYFVWSLINFERKWSRVKQGYFFSFGDGLGWVWGDLGGRGVGGGTYQIEKKLSMGEGRQPQMGCANPLFSTIFVENCMKMKEIGRGGGGP